MLVFLSSGRIRCCFRRNPIFYAVNVRENTELLTRSFENVECWDFHTGVIEMYPPSLQKWHLNPIILMFRSNYSSYSLYIRIGYLCKSRFDLKELGLEKERISYFSDSLECETYK